MRSKAHISSHPIHPMLIGLPIGLWIGSFVFDVLAYFTADNLLRGAGFYTAVAGCIGAALAAVPGVIDLLTVVPPRSSAKKRGYIHGALNTAVLLLFIVIAWRRGGPWEPVDGRSVLMSLLAVTVLGVSGWLGGTLVYRNQIGVDHRYANAGKWRERHVEDFTRPVCNQSELNDGQIMLVKIGTERVAVARAADGIFAFSDHCTHRGGPLSDGVLIGCTVQCPWHGSQFDCRTGRVVAGPAQRQIKTYEIDIRAGEVYVRDPLRTEQEKAA